MDKIKVLFAGESWFFTTTETKGFDQFTICLLYTSKEDNTNGI